MRHNHYKPDQAGSLAVALLRAREQVTGPVRRILAESDLTEQQWRVLRILVETGPLEPKCIADGVALMQPSLTRILRTLEERGLISRQPHKLDARRQLVEITESGLRIVEEKRPEIEAISERIRAGLGADKYNQLVALMTELSRVDPAA